MCAKGIQNAHCSKDQKVTHSPARVEKHAGPETPLQYTHSGKHQTLEGRVSTQHLHSSPARLADPKPYTRHSGLMSKRSRALLTLL